MTIDDKVRDVNMQYNINIKAAKISELSSGKIDKYEYLTDEEILPFSPLGKQTEKQVNALKSLDPFNKLKQIEGMFPQNLMNDLIRAKLKGIVELQEIIKKDDLNYKSKSGKLIILVNIHYLLLF